jgi:hypothetical protein
VTLGNAFLLTGIMTTIAYTSTAADRCSYDFLAIAGGFDPVTGAFFDRYCGGKLKSASVCSMFDLFTLVISLFNYVVI